MIIAENAEKLEIAKYKEKMQLVLLENKKSPAGHALGRQAYGRSHVACAGVDCPQQGGPSQRHDVLQYSQS